MEGWYRDLEGFTKRVIRLYGIRVRKRLSQHFVVDPKLLEEILQHVAKLKPTRIVEVGTGLGVLTAALRKSAGYVVTIELDSSLARVARDHLLSGGYGLVDVLVGDGVSIVTSGFRADIIVSNVPYSITGPLINSIVKSGCRAAVLTLQKEVAERLTAAPGSKHYSRLTVMVNTFMDVELGGVYPPTSFLPPPKVHSRVAVLKRLRPWSYEWKVYEDLIKCLFNQKRKLVRKVLRCCVDEELISKLDVELGSLINGKRVYQLPVEIFMKIYSTIYH